MRSNTRARSMYDHHVAVQGRLEDALGTFRVTVPPPPVTTARPEIDRLRATGAGWTQIARDLNARGIPTPTGRGQWWPNTVYRHVNREGWNRYMRRYRAR